MTYNTTRWAARVALAMMACGLTTMGRAQRVVVKTHGHLGLRGQYAAEYLAQHLPEAGYKTNKKGPRVSTPAQDKTTYQLTLRIDSAHPGLQKEGYAIERQGRKITITGRDGSGAIYGCVELVDRAKGRGHLKALPTSVVSSPEMVLRGACVGLQKTVYLPGHQVYEYPYTPQNFPWFYDKALWTRYLDMLVENKMNSLYLWNGHPFASLVKLKDYPFALEVDEATFKKNEEMFSFLTHEADRRGIFVIQMFYNIIVSKPFADHYGLKTQDRQRPITPLLSDYTRKSVAAFIEKYPNVGLLVCLGEAMATYEDDVEWMTKTIIPGVKDGLRALGRTDEPPLLVRAHDTDPKAVMEASLPLYHNLYTMHKYNGESLTTYEPRGPWAETHRELAALGSTHISNVHILANLEPFRWSSPIFVQKSVEAMHSVHHARALHLYPQASYWDWPYTADKLPGGGRLLQIDRDWMWYATWGRYAWNDRRSRPEEISYWDQRLQTMYGTDSTAADNMRRAYEEQGEIAPKLLRRFGITEGNRQTLLLGMMMSQLVNPYKYTIYPGFYESCGPEGEKLIEYVEREWKHQQHVGELPLDIVDQVERHGDRAVEAIDAAAPAVTKNKEEFGRVQNDMHCYRELAYSFGWKVRAARHVLNYQWGKDLAELDTAATLLEKSLSHYRRLVDLTRDTYLYANSMQTAQRRIPIGGNGGKMKHWAELLPRYEAELANLRKNTAMLRKKVEGGAEVDAPVIEPLHNAELTLPDSVRTVMVKRGAWLLADLDSMVTDVAPELVGLHAMVVNTKRQRAEGTTVSFSCSGPVKLLVGYFRDDQSKYARAPKLETDATANDYGQAEPQITSAIRIAGLPQVDVHAYSFDAGTHTLRLPKGIALVLGATDSTLQPRDAGLSGEDKAMDWLFY